MFGLSLPEFVVILAIIAAQVAVALWVARDVRRRGIGKPVLFILFFVAPIAWFAALWSLRQRSIDLTVE